MRRTSVALSVVLSLVVTDVAQAAPRPRLKAFSSCKQLVDYARAGALRTDGGPGVIPRAAPVMMDAVVTPPLAPPPQTLDRAAASPVSAEGGAGIAGTDFSGTNTQEIGVDEPDILKTDGRRVFTVTDRTLRVIDVASGAVTGTLGLEGQGHVLLLRGNRVLAISAKGVAPVFEPGRPDVSGSPVYATDTTIVTEIDVSGAPKVMRTMEVPGTFVDARQNGATARLVIDAQQTPIIPPPGQPVGAAVRKAKLSKFLGHTTLRSKLSGRTFKRNLTPCKAVAHPAQFSGLGVLAILTIDLDRGMYSLDRDGVMAGAQVVYGSEGSLYVASRRYQPRIENGSSVPEGVKTEIHRFDISDPSKTVYRATGTVPGFVLNNYALSEFEGKLRVASTEEPVWFNGAQQGEQQSTVTVLDQVANKLVRVGSVTGLGKGERIYAVRFMGAQGYVVTFRQVDPLYTLDLRDPTAPKVVGELKIPGYSAYLHPVGEGRLLGIGREGSAVQASLFDVSDPALPQRLAQYGFGPGATPVEADPHAFLYWAKTNLAVIPLNSYGEPPFVGAEGLRIGPNTLTSAGRIEHSSAERGQIPIDRTFVIGDRLYTLSYLGLLASDLTSLGGVRFTAF
jgi:uncharacterized secreted protein with C-terminal beta-propeller domain